MTATSLSAGVSGDEAAASEGRGSEGRGSEGRDSEGRGSAAEGVATALGGGVDLLQLQHDVNKLKCDKLELLRQNVVRIFFVLPFDSFFAFLSIFTEFSLYRSGSTCFRFQVVERIQKAEQSRILPSSGPFLLN